jgi:6-pyruvoyltetrahydropterin/6-carboxytetrahydropterin synthase
MSTRREETPDDFGHSVASLQLADLRGLHVAQPPSRRHSARSIGRRARSGARASSEAWALIRSAPEPRIQHMERWSIELAKEYFKFSAAHFLIFPDGSSERLHGHNYRVRVELEARLTQHGLVLDFKQAKPVVRELVDELDEHWLIPGEHPVLRYRRDERGQTHVEYRGLNYSAPSDDVIVLPINNTSSENLSTWLGRELARRLAARFPDVEIQRLRVAVEETSGQWGVYQFERDA